MDSEMLGTEGKYRWRTWLRGVLPGWLTWIAPKGARDCGSHEWYRSDEHTWRCYHCETGVSYELPFSPSEQVQHELEELSGTLRYLSHQPLSTDAVATERTVAEHLLRLAERQEDLAAEQG